MYAEVRETNGQPEKPNTEFDSTDPSSTNYDYARVPKKGMFVTATEEAVDQPQSTPIVEHQYAAVSNTGKNVPTAMAATEDTAPNPGDGSPHPQPKAHRKPPPPKPSPFSGKPHMTRTRLISKLQCALEKTLFAVVFMYYQAHTYKDTIMFYMAHL